MNVSYKFNIGLLWEKNASLSVSSQIVCTSEFLKRSVSLICFVVVVSVTPAVQPMVCLVE